MEKLKKTTEEYPSCKCSHYYIEVFKPFFDNLKKLDKNDKLYLTCGKVKLYVKELINILRDKELRQWYLNSDEYSKYDINEQNLNDGISKIIRCIKNIETNISKIEDQAIKEEAMRIFKRTIPTFELGEVDDENVEKEKKECYFPSIGIYDIPNFNSFQEQVGTYIDLILEDSSYRAEKILPAVRAFGNYIKEGPKGPYVPAEITSQLSRIAKLYDKIFKGNTNVTKFLKNEGKTLSVAIFEIFQSAVRVKDEK